VGRPNRQLFYDGEPPERKRLVIDKGFPETFDESLVVDPKSRGLANVFIYLRGKPAGDAKLTPHPSYAEAIKQPIEWVIKDQGYSPHVMLIHTFQPVTFIGRSKGAFNIKSEPFKNGSSSVLIPPQQQFTRIYQHSEVLPATFDCNIHPWFQGYALIRDNPYMTVTDSDGRFTIKNLPTGEHEFQFWHEKCGYMKLPIVQLRGADVAGKL